MLKRSQNMNQDTTQEEQFIPKSFVIFCLNEKNEVAFEASWGTSAEDIKKFAHLMRKINDGNFEDLIFEQLQIQSKEIKGGVRKYSSFKKEYYKRGDLDVVVDPTEVELT